jgi:hypothetical protein
MPDGSKCPSEIRPRGPFGHFQIEGVGQVSGSRLDFIGIEDRFDVVGRPEFSLTCSESVDLLDAIQDFLSDVALNDA